MPGVDLWVEGTAARGGPSGEVGDFKGWVIEVRLTEGRDTYVLVSDESAGKGSAERRLVWVHLDDVATHRIQVPR